MDNYSKYGHHMGIHGPMYDNSSAVGRMQQQYWTTKQVVLRKLGKKEDDCVIASDLELDLKLKVFQTIEESFLMLMRLLENYQDRLCALAQEENALGRFLKENGKQDKTKAGKAMISTGKALSYSAQQRLSLRIPLVRLYEEVETFHYQAIVDTLKTVEKMEKSRTAYRGTLMWMKDVSQQLDPDTCKQMEKFRKVQRQVKKSKQGFDKLKLDTLQKVDLLSFSRCNLFSQSLAAYQNSLININKKIAFTSNSEAISTKQNNQFEFSVIKELEEEKSVTMEFEKENNKLQPSPDEDKDRIIFFEAEYHDEVNCNASAQHSVESIKKESLQNHVNTMSNTTSLTSSKAKQLTAQKSDGQKDSSELSNYISSGLTDDELLLLNDTIGSSMNSSAVLSDSDMSFNSEWQAVFGDEKLNMGANSAMDSTEKTDALPSFLPSQLLNICSEETPLATEGTSLMSSQPASGLASNSNPINSSGTANKGKRDMSAWFNLFADLDPLANPDMIGEKKENIIDRNC